MQLISGPRAHSQNWSRGFYDGYPGIDGVLYPSSLTNQTVYAFYERVLEVASPFPRLPIVHFREDWQSADVRWAIQRCLLR